MKLTIPDAIVQTLLLVASIVNATVSPEVAEAVGVYGAPPTTAADGAVEVKLIVWAPVLTVKLC